MSLVTQPCPGSCVMSKSFIPHSLCVTGIAPYYILYTIYRAHFLLSYVYKLASLVATLV